MVDRNTIHNPPRDPNPFNHSLDSRKEQKTFSNTKRAFADAMSRPASKATTGVSSTTSEPTNTTEPERHVHRHQTYPQDAIEPPPLNYTLHTGRRYRFIGIFFALIFIEACVLPLILFYSLRWGAHLSIRKNLAIITSLIGTVSGLKVGQRTYYLWICNGHESRRPIGAGRWGVDFFHILISVALTMFFIPLIIGSSLTQPSVPTVSMALPCFMLAICIPMFISGLFPRSFRLPFRISSFPPYHVLPPLTYTIVEDIIAVDGGGGLEFRQAWRHRYEESRVMRKLLRDIALVWGTTGIVAASAFIAISWNVSDDIGYGISYGLPWLWAFLCTFITIWWTRKELRREEMGWADVRKVHREKHLDLVETQVERDVYERVLARRSLSITRPREDVLPFGDRRKSMPDPIAHHPPRSISGPSDAVSV